MLLLHGFQLVFGRSARVGGWLKSLLRDVLIQGNQKSKVRFRREVSYCPLLEVTDTVMHMPPGRIMVGGKVSYNAVPSSKYFQDADLAHQPVEVAVHQRASVKIVRRYDANGMLVGAPVVSVF